MPPPPPPPRRTAIWVTALLLLWSVALFWIAFGPGVTGEYVATDDAAQHVFWLYAHTGDHGFVPGDPMVAHAELIQPFGFWAFARGAVLLFDPMDLSRWLPLPLLAVTVWLLFALLRTGMGVGAAAAATVLASAAHELLAPMAGGHARGFQEPLLLLVLLLIARRRPIALGAALVACALFYPPVFTLAGAIAGADALLRWRRDPKAFRSHVLPVVAAGLLGAAVVGALVVRIHQSPAGGAAYTAAEMREMPEFGPRGRSPLLEPTRRPLFEALGVALLTNMPVPVAGGLAAVKDPGSATGATHAAAILLLWVLLAGGWIAAWRAKRLGAPIDRLLLLVFAVSVLLFVAAVLLAPMLYIPKRYLQLSWFIPVAGLVRLLEVWAGGRRQWGIALAALLVLPALPRARSAGLYDYRPLAPLYEALRQGPSPAMVAAPPLLCDTIGLFARRSCLSSYEMALCNFRSYWEPLRERTFDLLEALWARDPEQVRRFVKHHEVDWIVVDPGFYGPGGGAYFEPFGARLAELSAEEGTPALLQLRGPAVGSVGERFRLVDARGWR